MSTAKKILDRLSGVKETKGGWMARCPAHDDGKPSLSISEGEGGRVLLKCFVGCSTKAIVEALGLAERDLFDADASRRDATKFTKGTSGNPSGRKQVNTKTYSPATRDAKEMNNRSTVGQVAAKAGVSMHKAPKAEKKAGKAYATDNDALKAYERTLGRIIATMPPGRRWSYSNADHKHVGSVYRWNNLDGTKREIRPTSLHADGWRLEHMPTPRPLFNLCDWISEPGRVYVVEGEKAAEAIHGLSGSREGGLGLLATTSAGGSSSAKQSDWTPLAGRDVVILPDADAPGRKYAAEVAEILLALDPPATVRIVDLDPDADDGSDVADLVVPARCLGEPLRELIERQADATEPLAARPTKAAATSSTETKKASAPVDAYEAFPVDALPEPLAAFVSEAAAAIGVDPAYVGLPLLPVVGAAIGTTLRLELKADYSVPAIVWAAVVGSSGTSKSPALRAVLAATREHDRGLRQEAAELRREHESTVEVYEAAAAAWRKAQASGRSTEPPPIRPEPPRGRRALVVDATTEALAERLADNSRGLLLARDELSGWLGSLNRYSRTGASADESFYLSAYNAEPLSIDRRTGDRREIDVPLAALWIVGTIQAGILQRALTTERREAGLLARLLLTSPPPRAARWTEAEVSFSTRQAFADVIAGLYRRECSIDEESRETPLILRLDAKAKAAYVAFFDRTSAELVELGEGDLAAAWSKLRETAARIALILHAAKAEADRRVELHVVDADSMSRAIRLAEWLKVETRRTYRFLQETSEERGERTGDERLLVWIGRQAEPVTARDVVTGCRWIETADDAEAALRRLVDAGRGRWVDKPPGERGGRPTRLFVLDRLAAGSTPEASRGAATSAQLRETRPKRSFGNADSAAAPLTKGVVEL